MTPTRMSLYSIESELADLIDLREEMIAKNEPIEAINGQIAVYVSKEIGKVDNIRGFLKHCSMMANAAKQERDVQAQRAKTWQDRYDTVKELCKAALEAVGKRKIEGRTGSLILKTDGGRQAVTITDASLIPEELCQYEGSISGEAWGFLAYGFSDADMWAYWTGRADVQMVRIPHKGRIAVELDKPCECANIQPCAICGGSGKHGVPGAHLAPRGQHIEVR